MAACGVRPEHAAEEVQGLLRSETLRKRRLGLVGILGGITRTWLDKCLPNDAGERMSRRSTVLVTQLPLLTTSHITTFKSKQDVVEVLMASAHLPLLLDWSWFAVCRQRPVIDGGFWWWWHRCEMPYKVIGGVAPSPPLLTLTSGRFARTASHDNAVRITQTIASLPGGGAGASSSWEAEAVAAEAMAPGLWWPSQSRRQEQRPAPVSYSCPTSILDFIAADVQRFMAPDAGLIGGGGGGGSNSGQSYVSGGGSGSSGDAVTCGAVLQFSRHGLTGGAAAAQVSSSHPSAAAAAAAAAQGQTAAGTGADPLWGTHVRKLASAATAITPPRSQASLQLHCRAGDVVNNAGWCIGGGGGGGRGGARRASPTVLLIQPSDDDALAAGWRRYRRWRPDDLAAAREMMAHGEAYGSGPLLRRLECTMT